MPHTILITAPKLSAAGIDLLEQAGCRLLFVSDQNDATAIARVLASEPVDAIISRTMQLDATAIAQCPSLKVIAKHGVGVSNIDVEAATARGIPVFVTPAANAQSVAELSIGLMLAAARRIARFDRDLRAGQWLRAGDGQQLAGRTLGLVGFGQIGQRVARVALALDMRVLAFDPGLGGVSPVAGVAVRDSLDALLPDCHVLSLHCPLTAATRGMLGRAQLARLQPAALVINTARGELIDEAALLDALASGQVAAAGLDTFCQEPLLPGNPLFAHPHVVMTPHIGGSTPDALAAMAAGAARHVLAWLNGESPQRSACINPHILPQEEFVS